MGEGFTARRVRLTAFAVVAAVAVAVAIIASRAADASRSGAAKPTATNDLVAQAKANVLAAAGWPKTWKGPTTSTKPQKVKNVVLTLSFSERWE